MSGSVSQLLRSFAPELVIEGGAVVGPQTNFVPFKSDVEIKRTAQKYLTLLQHTSGAVDLENLCKELKLQLTFSESLSYDSDGNPILGTANFRNKMIEVNLHGNKHRERFTIAHEIGHFCLRHDQYLHSDSITEHDLLVDAQSDCTLNYERLEHQANIFASELLLPDGDFRISVEGLRLHIGIVDRGFGYIFVDDQPCNYNPYNERMYALSSHFEVSKHAIEIRLKRMGLITDQRGNSQLRKINSQNR